jgi:hypothetical protein
MLGTIEASEAASLSEDLVGRDGANSACPDSRISFDQNEGEGMRQFYAKAEDEERCLESSISRQPITMRV